ncbi:hypothetical protein FRB90_011568 [Tulasnella sp. 427]|nr:hypothetical protein FRB90_011568 [Tulasnella sp. 427]
MAARGRIVPVLFAGAVGVISGIYIWKPLLEQELKQGPKGLEELSKTQAQSSPLPLATPAPETSAGQLEQAQPLPLPPVQTSPSQSPIDSKIITQATSTAQKEPPFKRDVGEDQSATVWSWSRWFGGSSSSPNPPSSNSKKA